VFFVLLPIPRPQTPPPFPSTTLSRSEAMTPPDKTPELFERFLPYAIALDCENTWAKRFAGVLAAAAATATGATVGSWYAGQDNWSDNPVAFADHLGDSLSQTIAAAAT